MAFLRKFSLVLYCTLLGVFYSSAQSLSQDEVKDLVIQAKRMGYSDQQILEYAKQQGVSQEQLQFMSTSPTAGSRAVAGETVAGDRLRIYSDSLKSFPKSYFKRKEIPEEYFGYSFFSFTNFSSFESNINIATPKNYLVGSGDELYLDIYGKSEQYYEAVVDNNGSILLENLGPIHVAGLTIEKVNELIKARLSRIYTGLNGQSPDTYLRITLGSVRSIMVQLAGELVAPGSYTMSSFSTVLNALHMAGGPTVNGSLRSIRIFRAGKQIGEFDFYKFLVEGNLSGNLVLEDNDVVLVPPFLSRVELKGQFKRPGFFEIATDEVFSDVLKYSGGLTDLAYTERVMLTRNLSKEKVVSDVYFDQFSSFQLKGGDVVEAKEVLERYTNRVQIKGAVFRPGPYAYSENMTVSDLIARADGLRGDAYLDRVLITRLKADLTTETLSVNLKGVGSESGKDLVLTKEDVVWIQSIFDLKEELYLKISGEVNSPGTFIYSDGMTIADLVFKANGFTKAAHSGVIEISRRSENQTSTNQTEILSFPISDGENLSAETYSVKLKPFDHLMVRRNPDHFPEKTVRVVGEVNYPGTYSILSESERISDLIPRAGGLRELAYTSGATLIRRTEFYSIEEETQTKREDLEKVLQGMDTVNMTESDMMLRSSLMSEILRLSNAENENLSAAAKSERLMGIAQRSALQTEIDVRTSELIPLDLEGILQKPRGDEDLILQEGDVITIPQKQETIRLRGRVLYPTTVKHIDGKGLGYFISQAGGFDSQAFKRKTYVLYPNGEVARTRHFLFFRSYPQIMPGTEIIVPAKPFKPPVGIAGYTGIGTSLAAILIAISNFNIIK